MKNNVSRESVEWQRARVEALKRDQYRCQHCQMAESKWRGVDLQVHHIRPVASGGSHDLDNLVALCNGCHQKLHSHFNDRDELPPKLLEEREFPTFGMLDHRKEFNELNEIQQDIVSLLKDNGPTQLKYIIEHTGYSRGHVQKQLELLKVGKQICRVSRGVYAYIPELSFRDLQAQEPDEHGRRRVRVWDPGEQIELTEAVADGGDRDA